MLTVSIKPAAGFLSAIILLTGCASNEIAQSRDVNQDQIYQQYSINYHEGEPAASVNGTFRFGGENGTTLVLSEPSSLKVNGDKTGLDSGWASGAFYRYTIPVQKILGSHVLAFTNTENKTYLNNFQVDSFSIINLPESTPRNQGLVVQFTAPDMGTNDYIEIRTLDTDSSFSLTTVGNLKMITISQKELMRQKSDVLKLEAVLYREFKVSQATSIGGSLQLRHSLKPVSIKLN